MIAEDKVAEVRERTDIVALVQEYVTLKKVGASYKGLCPFHNEKTPSFHVHPARGFYYCFGCQASGDAIRFLMSIEGRPFPDAVRTLADRIGIEIPMETGPEDQAMLRARKREQRRVAVMDAATTFFERALRGDGGRLAREELERRGINQETADAFRLGYAPHGWDHLRDALAEMEVSPDMAEELGLLAPRRSGRGHYDRFRHRLMFPISDHQGRVVAFSGRALPPPSALPSASASSAGASVGDRGAKYVNSPEGPLYHKGKILYGLFEGRVAIRREGWAILCEGNFDLVALHQAGFLNAVAPMGTALTVEQAKLIRRYCDRVVFLFDGDGAGASAVRKAAPVVAAAGLSARVATLPPGEDPDGYLRQRGPESLRGLLDGASGMIEHLIDSAAEQCGIDAAAKSQAIQGLGPVLMQASGPVEAQLYVERVSQKFGISNQVAVREQLRRGVRSRRQERNGLKSRVPIRPGTSRRATRHTLPSMECELVGALLDHPTLFGSEVASRLRELLTSSDLRAILMRAADSIDANGALRVSALLASFDSQRGFEGAHAGEGNGGEKKGADDELAAANELSAAGRAWLEQRLAIARHDAESAESVVESGIVQLQLRSIQQELPMLSRKIIEAQRHGDASRVDELLRQRETLRGAALKLQALKSQAKGPQVKG